MKNKKILGIVLLAVSLLAANGTVAWLFRSAAMTNTFAPATVTGEITETFDKNVKKNVSVKNTSDIPVYIRVALVPTWMDGNHATALKTEGTYSITFNSSNKWIKGSDGFYYYKESVAVGESTAILINSCQPLTGLGEAYQGKQFELDLISSFIQAEPTAAVTEAWKVTVAADGTISK